MVKKVVGKKEGAKGDESMGRRGIGKTMEWVGEADGSQRGSVRKGNEWTYRGFF